MSFVKQPGALTGALQPKGLTEKASLSDTSQSVLGLANLKSQRNKVETKLPTEAAERY